MASRIRTDDPHGFNKGCSSKFHDSSRVQQTPEKGWRTYRPKCCGNNYKDGDNSPKILVYMYIYIYIYKVLYLFYDSDDVKITQMVQFVKKKDISN